jgi:hypothetical protein
MTTLVAFLFALALLIFVHELGHYSVARWCGVKVLRFSIGFGKPLLRYTVGADQRFPSLDVAETLGRIGGSDPKGHDPLGVLLDEPQAGLDCSVEFALGLNHMVRRHDDHHAVFVGSLDQRRRDSNTRCRVPFDRFANDVLDR